MDRSSQLRLLEGPEAGLLPAIEVGHSGLPSHAFVSRLRRGDSEALTQLYQAYRASLFVLARRLLGDDLEAADLIHDTFVATPRALRRLSGATTLSTFLCSTVVSLCRRRLGSLRRRRRVLRKVFDLGAAMPVQYPASMHTLRRRELTLQLTVALDRLRFVQRAAVVLCLVEERPASEAAEILDVSEATMRVHLIDARKKLRALLGEAT